MVRVRELETVRLRARGLPTPLIAKQTGVTERQVRRDLQRYREHEGEGLAPAILEVFEELFRVAWQDHDQAKKDADKVAALKALTDIADRLAFLAGINFRAGTGINILMQQQGGPIPLLVTGPKS